MSERTIAHSCSLTGITDPSCLILLEKSFFKAIVFPEVNMQMLFSSFGGFPRLYSRCLKVIKRDRSVQNKLKELEKKIIDCDTANFLYEGVLNMYRDTHSMHFWINAFRMTEEGLDETCRSHPSRMFAFEYLN